MERIEQHEDVVIDLGAASLETQGQFLTVDGPDELMEITGISE